MLHGEDATGPLVSLPVGAMNSSSEPVLKTRLAICRVFGGSLYGTATAGLAICPILGGSMYGTAAAVTVAGTPRFTSVELRP